MSQRSSHTHCQVAQADTQTKTCQRVCLPQPTSRQKMCSKLKDKMTEMNQHQAVTFCISNGRQSAKYQGL